jgi:hypothetical protein
MNSRIRSHLAILRMIQGDRPGAQKAAVEAERLGLAGLRGWPNAAMIESYGIEVADSRESGTK